MANQEQMDHLHERLNKLLEEEEELLRAVELLGDAHPADRADLIEQLEEGHRSRLLEVLSHQHLAEVLEYLDEDMRADLLAGLEPEFIAPLLDRVDDDVAADIVQELESGQADRVLQLLEDREAVQEILSYPAESAGGRMSSNVVALHRYWTVEDVIVFLRREVRSDQQPFYLYVVDQTHHLIGTVSLRALVISPPETPIAALMSEEVRSVLVTDDQEAVAEQFRHYSLLALPVVDDEGRLRGVITADDVLAVQVQEATEDIYRMAGLAEEERLFRPIRQSVPPRMAWLSLNLLTALIAAFTVSAFEGTIARVAVLAVFMPLVAGMGGNAGLQTLTLVVRSIALGEVEPRDAWRVLRHEAGVALVNGLVIGLAVAGIALAWKGNGWLALIVGVAILANIANAMLVGVMVPLALRRLKVDPALASGVISTFADVVGFLIFLGLGALLVTKLS